VAGAVISASHNPAAENGIKFLGHDGTKLSDETEARIEALVTALRAEPAAAARLASPRVGRYRADESLVASYMAAARSACGAAATGLHIVVDGANGAGSRLNPAVLEDAGFRVTRIHCAPNGLNINEACGSTHPEDLCRSVVENGADLGAAFDGDGDRVILSDEKGRVVDGDRIMALCAANWVDTAELPGNTVVGTVMSNIGLERFLGSIGVTFLRTPVGDRYVAARMRETGAAIGGEKSGHIVFSRFATTGDGLVTLFRVLTAMSDTGRRLSELADLMEEYPQRLVGVPVSRREGWERDPRVAAAIREGEKRLEGRGRLLVRASGTENLVRVMAEGPDDDEVKAVVEAVTAALRAWAQ
jgi:phosphoglucosamine mutase